MSTETDDQALCKCLLYCSDLELIQRCLGYILKLKKEIEMLKQLKKDCKHDNHQIWEPHLAGARKCLDCGMVYNPNSDPSWMYEF